MTFCAVTRKTGRRYSYLLLKIFHGNLAHVLLGIGESVFEVGTVTVHPVSCLMSGMSELLSTMRVCQVLFPDDTCYCHTRCYSHTVGEYCIVTLDKSINSCVETSHFHVVRPGPIHASLIQSVDEVRKQLFIFWRHIILNAFALKKIWF